MFKRILTLAVALAIPLAALAADTKISAFPSMSALGATDIFLGNQGGVTSTATAAQFNTYVRSTFTAPPAIGGGTPAAGAFTTLSSSGLFQPALGITATGAIINLNDSSNFAVNIGTTTSTGTVTLGQNSATPGAVAIKGPVSFQASTNFSGASWTTTSPVWNGAAMTLNDTTASGTDVTETAYSMQAPNFTSTGGASTTITNATNLWLAAPTCSGGVVCTNLFSLFAAGKINGTGGMTLTGATTSINPSSNFAINIGTGSDNALITIGGGSNGIIMNAGLATGYVKNTGFISVGTKFTLGGGSGSCATSSTTVGGAAAGSFVCTGTAGAGAITITINGATGLAAPNGWSCYASDITSGTIWTQSGVATTTCTIKGTTAANTDVIAFGAQGY